MVEDAKRVLKRKTLIQKVIAKIFIYTILLIMYAPILYLVVFSFTSSKVIGTWSGFYNPLPKSKDGCGHRQSKRNGFSSKMFACCGRTDWMQQL